MQKLFEDYIQSISAKFAHEETSEMGYRTDFEILLKRIFESISIKRIDHDAMARQGNKPDFVVINKDIPILYIEAKKIGVSLDKIEKSEQMARYFGYTNLVLTDYVEFRFYRNGIRYEEPIKIADYDLKNRTIIPIQKNYEHVVKSLIDFSQSQKEPIKSGKHLAKIMGGKAQRIRDNVREFLSSHSTQNTELARVYEAMKKMLVHDLTIESFSDMYAQTLVYGLFVARYYDETPYSFTRQEARDLVPVSNPFLQHFFDHIVGPNFDKRLSYIVDELCLVFQHSNVKKLIENYLGNADPVIHFYEDFLKEYDPELRKKMGAYYTPLPVVRFIVRTTDQILKKEFNLTGGLANTLKLANGNHKVQILDPATGTGTFISAVIAMIFARLKKQGQTGRWPTYVHNDLLPRLHGFELMMAPYTIAHLKLSLAFKQTGFWKFHKRLGIYLTNSLEQIDTQQSLLSFGFAESIAEEAKDANKIKKQTPIMIVLGNPPYSGHSSNKGLFEKELDVYKKEFDGSRLNERNPKWLNDDYVKFMRFGEMMIEKNKEGILSFITNHAYLDNPTFRGMRYHLLKTFDCIYIIDLHGNAKKKEISPDGSVDENVFDIQQGVAIIVATKKGEKRKDGIATLYKADIFGKREQKFATLDNLSLNDKLFEKVEFISPQFLFKNIDTGLKAEYDEGFSIPDLFQQNSVGIVTAKDGILIANNEQILEKQVTEYFEKQKIKKIYDPLKVRKIAYRPLDDRFIYYDCDLIERPRMKVMRNFDKNNLGIVMVRQIKAGNQYNHIFITNKITESTLISNKTSEIDYIFPLYLYSGDVKTENLNPIIINKIQQITETFSPEELSDYIYAVLHSQKYREKYKEFLKIDFSRVPYPKDKQTFKQLIKLGRELRELHLMESPKLNKFITTYPVSGSNIVENVKYWPLESRTFWKGHEEDAKIHRVNFVSINNSQYFGDIPEVAWDFYIGGYQPAQKWLKDRKGQELSNEDIEHYQKIIVALVETGKIMKKIDEIKII